MANHLASYNVYPFYHIPSRDQMANSVYDLTLSLLDELLPPKVAIRHTNDRPWITDQFRSLIRRLQAAWSSKETLNYRRLRNKINHMLPKLKKNYFATKLHCLQNTNSHNWWGQTNIISGQTTQAYSGIESLANHVTEEDVHALADKINIFFHSVSKDLPPMALFHP